MGLPGTGKTTLAGKLNKMFNNCSWFNSDKVREMTNDWDFTIEGRIRQAKRMNVYANFELENNRLVICDFIAPTKKSRDIFSADFIIWMNTVDKSRYEDTNQIFQKPQAVNLEINDFNYDIKKIFNQIQSKKINF